MRVAFAVVGCLFLALSIFMIGVGMAFAMYP